MLRRLGYFLKYNNTVPLTVAVVLLGASSTFAANNPELFYEETTTIVSIDNTYIANIDLDAFTPYTEITEVREDDEFYYITYTVSSINLVDAVWQDTETTDTLRVRKTRLGEYGDLGLYVTEQLKQIIDNELARLRETQSIERTNVTQKQLATSYSGLIGARLDASVETIPGYVPRVQPPRETPESMNLAMPGPGSTVSEVRTDERSISLAMVPAEAPATGEDEDAGSAINAPLPATSPSSDNSTPTPAPAPTLSDTAPLPYLQVLGASSITLLVGETYTDLGVAVVDAGNLSPVVQRSVNGQNVSTIALSTDSRAEYVIEYVLMKGDLVYDRLERTVTVVSSLPTDTVSGTAGTTSAPTTPTTPTSTVSATTTGASSSSTSDSNQPPTTATPTSSSQSSTEEDDQSEVEPVITDTPIAPPVSTTSTSS